VYKKYRNLKISRKETNKKESLNTKFGGSKMGHWWLSWP